MSMYSLTHTHTLTPSPGLCIHKVMAVGPVPCGGAAGYVGAGGGGTGCGGGGGGGCAGASIRTNMLLGDLNTDQSLDASNLLNSNISDNENISHFFQTHLQSDYFDADSFIAKFKNNAEPILSRASTVNLIP
jgi:hypothetical protein